MDGKEPGPHSPDSRRAMVRCPPDGEGRCLTERNCRSHPRLGPYSKGQPWLAAAKDPHQFLAHAIELVAALKERAELLHDAAHRVRCVQHRRAALRAVDARPAPCRANKPN